MPEGAIYWYGNLVNCQSTTEANGWTTAYGSEEPTYNTRDVKVGGSTSAKMVGIGTPNAIDLGAYSVIKTIVTDKGSSSRNCVGATSDKSITYAASNTGALASVQYTTTGLITVDISGISSYGYVSTGVREDTTKYGVHSALWVE